MDVIALKLLPHWGLEPGCLRPDIALPGSPERCHARAALADAHGTLWVLEQLRPGQSETRQRIGQLLDFLAQELDFVVAYRQTQRGDFVLQAAGAFWQLAPFVMHEPLPRPQFVEEAQRGASMGGCLVRLQQAGAQAPQSFLDHSLHLPGYVSDLVQTIEHHAPAVYARAKSLEGALAPLWNAWDTLPRGLCHGDSHPLNALWNQQRVTALIDWEFCGLRPRLYDLANCLGCVGIEEPMALKRGFAMGLVEAVREELLADASALLLPELLLGIRFAWLSEWFRHKDEQLVSLELDYMELLARSLERLRDVWGLEGG